MISSLAGAQTTLLNRGDVVPPLRVSCPAADLIAGKYLRTNSFGGAEPSDLLHELSSALDFAGRIGVCPSFTCFPTGIFLSVVRFVGRRLGCSWLKFGGFSLLTALIEATEGGIS